MLKLKGSTNHIKHIIGKVILRAIECIKLNTNYRFSKIATPSLHLPQT